MRYYFFFFLLFYLLTSCNPNNTVIIKGDIKNLKADKIFLIPVYPMNSPAIDSAEVLNGRFEFVLTPDTAFIANLIMLSYKDPVKGWETLPLCNPFKKKDRYASFIMEPGLTKLTGDLAKGRRIDLEAGEQNEFYFKNINLPYMRISRDSVKRENQAQQITNSINDFPDAYWALFAVNNLRYRFSHPQLVDMYEAFSDDMRFSYEGKQFKRFIDLQPKTKDAFPNSKFSDITGKKKSLVDPVKKLTLVVFWASWCGPCRREIPSLKRIYSKLPEGDFKIVSVSIDEKRNDWLKAVNEENMLWQQLLIQTDEIEAARAKYNLGWIPQIYLVNNKYKVIKQIDGFDESMEGDLQTFISNYLNL